MEVAILGCGYVGTALGEALTAAGHRAVGVRRSPAGVDELSAAGLEAVRADVTDGASLESVPDVDAVVFAASSGGGDAEAARSVYVEGLETVVSAFAGRPDPPNQLVYTSSTGVYGDHGGGWVDEDSELRPATERARVLVEAEGVARRAADAGIEPTVARLAGIYGPGRTRLERYLEGPVTEGYLNLLHRSDAAGALRFLLEHEAPDTVVLVDDEPVWKPDLAAWLAAECGVEPPESVTVEERLAEADRSAEASRRLRGQKRCSNRRLRSLGYEFTYPTYREGYRPEIGRYLAD